MLKHFSLPVLLGVILIHIACRQEDSSQRLFEKLTPAVTNIAFENTLEEESLFNSINYLYFYDGGGVAVGDINNDSLPDIYFTANMHTNRLYLNKGNFKFEDLTTSARLFFSIGTGVPAGPCLPMSAWVSFFLI